MMEYTGSSCSCGFDSSKYKVQNYHLVPGAVLKGKYRIGRVLGEGGFGITYVGYDDFLGRKVAVKEFYLNGYVSRNNTVSYEVVSGAGKKREIYESNLDKFVREGQLLAKFDRCPGIVSVLDYFKENGTAYLVMEFLEGMTLGQRIKKYGKIGAREMFDIIYPIMLSLEEIHNDKVIHRDISPDNIIISPDGDSKLLDFGAARLFEEDSTMTMSVILKPGYAPEEQYRNKGKQGPWSDIYSLCATMYRCMTGITPDSSMDRLYEDSVKKIHHLEPSCSVAFSEAIAKGMAVRQEYRYRNVAELRMALTQAIEGMGDDYGYTPVYDGSEIVQDTSVTYKSQLKNTFGQSKSGYAGALVGSHADITSSGSLKFGRNYSVNTGMDSEPVSSTPVSVSHWESTVEPEPDVRGMYDSGGTLETPDYEYKSVSQRYEEDFSYRNNKEEKVKARKLFITLFLIVVGILLILILIMYNRIVKGARLESKYTEAKEYVAAGNYEGGIENYISLGDYKDSKKLLNQTYFDYANALFSEGEFSKSIIYFENVEDSFDVEGEIAMATKMLKYEDDFKEAVALYNEKEYNKAAEAFDELASQGVVGCEAQKSKCYYTAANACIESEDYSTAAVYLEKCGDYEDAEELLEGIHYQAGVSFMSKGKYPEAINQFMEVKDYEDAEDLMIESMYIFSQAIVKKEHKSTVDDRSKAKEYLSALATIDYENSKELYAELTKWHVHIVVNNSKETTTTDLTTLPYGYEMYMHILVWGGDGSELNARVREVYDDGSGKNFVWQNDRGKNESIFSYTDGSVDVFETVYSVNNKGFYRFYLEDAETGHVVDSVEITIQ